MRSTIMGSRMSGFRIEVAARDTSLVACRRRARICACWSRRRLSNAVAAWLAQGGGRLGVVHHQSIWRNRLDGNQWRLAGLKSLGKIVQRIALVAQPHAQHLHPAASGWFVRVVKLKDRDAIYRVNR